MSLLIKKHKSGQGELVLVLYDEELKGKKLQEAGKEIDLSSPYYAPNTEKLDNAVQEAVFIQAIGKEAVKAVKGENEAKEMNGIPYVFLVRG